MVLRRASLAPPMTATETGATSAPAATSASYARSAVLLASRAAPGAPIAADSGSTVDAALSLLSQPVVHPRHSMERHASLPAPPMTAKETGATSAPAVTSASPDKSAVPPASRAAPGAPTVAASGLTAVAAQTLRSAKPSSKGAAFAHSGSPGYTKQQCSAPSAPLSTSPLFAKAARFPQLSRLTTLASTSLNSAAPARALLRSSQKSSLAKSVAP